MASQQEIYRSVSNLGQKTKKGTQQKSILSNKKTGSIRVIYNNQDITPEPLNPSVYEGTKERQLNVYSMTGTDDNQSMTDMKLFQSQSASRFQTDLQKQTVQAESMFLQSYLTSSYPEDIVIEPEKVVAGSLMDDDVEESNLPPGEDNKYRPMPNHISVFLAETETFWLLDMPSKTVEKDSSEAPSVEEQNLVYEYLTEGKGRNRKMVHAEVQTVHTLLKTRTTEAKRVRRRHNHAFASNWEMYDTFESERVEENPIINDFVEEELEQSDDMMPSAESCSLLFDEKQMEKLVENPKFFDAVCVIERLLANNNFNEQQKRFKGLLDPDPLREDIEYNYRLNLLWTFANDDTIGRCVTDMCWNDANWDIVAVGYGKFYYTERTTGLVLIWNIKNPVQPERKYRFENPVTSINFSKKNPNVLAVGFYSGDINLLDISSRELKVIGTTGKDSPSFEAIWQVAWFQGSDYFKDEEQITTAGEDGRISHYRPQDTVHLLYSQIMRISRPEGKLKGIETLRRCHVPGIPIRRYCSALVLQQHPADPNVYYVGTNEGTIHKCSRNYYHQHLDLFLAHDGPMYVMKFSPFCNKLFVTCGDDWFVRIWADGIVEPLFEISKAMYSVQGVDWSPTHSTVLANICGSEICIWDLQRKTYLPQSVTNSPTNVRCTVVQFTPCGRCLVVGDIEGNVQVFALEDMPFSAFFQDDLLINAIARGLVTRPDLITRLRKLNSLNFDKKTSESHFSK